MRPVTKRALVSTMVTALLATASILPGNAAMASDIASDPDAAAAATQPVTEETTPTPTAASQPASTDEESSASTTPAEGSHTEGAQTEGDQVDDTQAEGVTASSPANAPATGTSPAENAAGPEDAVATPAPEKTDYEIDLGFANWDFKKSFRDYVGRENEDRTGVRQISVNENLLWYPKSGQRIDVKNPTTLKFGGEVHWLKYNGILDVTISNPTIDFAKKQLLVDGSTKGTLAGGGAKTFTQTPLLDLADLTWEMKDGYLLIASHKPRVLEMSRELVGFYHGELGDPFVATIQLYDTNGAKAPEPILWELFPGMYPDPSTKPKLDPNEAVVDVDVDPRLAECIRTDLELKAGTPITNKFLQTIQSLQCISVNNSDDNKIKSLKGLEGAKNLTLITFSHNKISDLSPLAGLTKLHTVGLANNDLSDISVLTGLPKLSDLDVSGNKLTALPDMKKMSELSLLRAEGNRIKDLSPLPLGSDNLRKLYLDNNRIESLEPLRNHPYLRELHVADNRISDAAPLKRLRGLERVSLKNNFIADAAVFREFASFDDSWGDPNMKSLEVSGNLFTDWSAFDGFDKWRIKGRPEAGQESAAVNPRTLADALAADKKADEAEAAAQQNNQPKNEQPQTGDQPAKSYTAELHWGVRQSFRTYVTNPNLAKGKWTLSGGAKEGFVFPLADGATISRAATKFDFTGGVRFVGHKGNLDLTIANPTVVNDKGSWKLIADVASRPVPENLFAAPEVPADAPAPPSKRVTLATLDGFSMQRGEPSVYTFSSVTLTEEGDVAFGHFYPVGNRAMDAVKLIVSETKAPATEPKDQNPGTNTPGDTKPGTDAPGTTPGDTKPGTDAPGTRPAVLTADLNWGIRKSFLDYVTGLVAKGSIEVSEGATGRFVFPLADGKKVSHGGFTGAEFSGKVRFTGHNGLLDLTIANPAIVRDGQAWKLMADLASRPLEMPGAARPGSAARAALASAYVPELKRVHLADLAGMNFQHSNGGATITFSSVVLTEEGAAAFGGFYKDGNRALDPITVSVRQADSAGTTPKANDQPAGNTPSLSAPKQNNTAPAASGVKEEKKQKKECTVDPARKRITSGSLAWGVRSSFTTYVRGSIAKGGWNLNGVNWDGSTFNFPVSGGLYNTSTRSGTIYYSGTVKFYGHNGILDVTMSNPAVEINGNSGTLYLTVSGSDTSGNKFNLGRVAFASLGFNGVNVSENALSFDGASVTLTDTGAKAFAGFYQAGTALDPMSSSASITAATACDPETGELIEYDAFGGVATGSALASTGSDAQTLMWMSLLALAIGATAVGARARKRL